MSSKTQHEEQARHNETLRSSVLDTPKLGTHGSALHHLRAFLSSLREGCTGDDLRYDMLIIYLERLDSPFLPSSGQKTH